MSGVKISFEKPVETKDGRPDRREREITAFPIAFTKATNLHQVTAEQQQAVDTALKEQGLGFYGYQSGSDGLQVMAVKL